MIGAASPLSTRALPGSLEALEIEGLLPARDVTDAARCAELCEALARHGVICIRLAAALDEASFRGLASMIGPVKDPVARARDGGMLRYGEERQIIDSGFVLSEELRAQLGDFSLGGDSLRPGLFEFFHTDDSYTQCPAAATVLHAHALPVSGGGNTCFIDMRAAFRSLAKEQRERLAGLSCRSRPAGSGAGSGFRQCSSGSPPPGARPRVGSGRGPHRASAAARFARGWRRCSSEPRVRS